jgi:hypothetical protein
VIYISGVSGDTSRREGATRLVCIVQVGLSAVIAEGDTRDDEWGRCSRMSTRASSPQSGVHTQSKLHPPVQAHPPRCDGAEVAWEKSAERE